MELTAANVDTVMRDCLFFAEEAPNNQVPPDAVVVHGIIRSFGFHPGRLESHRENVRSMLMELPPEFLASRGGGMSFLNACMTRTGKHWGEHSNMECLFVLGIGLGLAKWCLPREMWGVMPGGMPYVVVDDKPKAEPEPAPVT